MCLTFGEIASFPVFVPFIFLPAVYVCSGCSTALLSLGVLSHLELSWTCWSSSGKQTFYSQRTWAWTCPGAGCPGVLLAGGGGLGPEQQHPQCQAGPGLCVASRRSMGTTARAAAPTVHLS